MSRVILLSVLGCCLVAAQTTKIDLQNQSRGVDFSAAPYTKPAKTGTALPPTCSTGEAYVLTTAAPGSNLFICTATNTWSLQGPGGSGGVTDHSQLTHLDYASSGHTGFQPALGYTPINSTTLAQPNGPAKLGSDGKILPSELPAATSGLAVAFATEQATGDGVQSIFNLAGTPLAGSLTVTINGQIQEAGPLMDYTLSGAIVTFAVPSIPPNGARISFRYAVSTGSGTPTVAFATDPATGNGSQTTFNLSSTPLSGSLIVAVNGQVREPGAQADYTQSGNTVTFYGSSVPANGARISFRYGYSINGGSGGQILMSQLPAGIPNGLATLGSDGKVPASQLPAAQSGGSGGTQSFTTPGATTWTVPSGVTRLFVQAWAGGGGGNASYYGSGGGGGGGGYAEGWCVVTPGDTPSVIVGAGGVAGVGSGAAGAGGDSSFASCVHAVGGGGSDLAHTLYPGKNALMPNGYYLNSATGNPFFPYASIGGSGCSMCFPSRNDQGGIGAYGPGHNNPGNAGGIAYYGGGGGGSGSDVTTAGDTQAGGPGGLSSFGGNGGNGGNVVSGVASACTPGAAPAGGGGGGSWDGTNIANGCAGARGQVTLWW